MQGIYRLLGQAEDLIEEFVAAPGPMGWRYFAHVHPPDDPGSDRFTVDLVTDLEWNLIRFRLAAADGWQAIATPDGSGVQVVHGSPSDERLDRYEGAAAVWSTSPSTLLVLHRMLGRDGGPIGVVQLERGFPPKLRQVALALEGETSVPTVGGRAEAERFAVVVDGRRREALIRADLPLSAEGWFELIA